LGGNDGGIDRRRAGFAAGTGVIVVSRRSAPAAPAVDGSSLDGPVDPVRSTILNGVQSLVLKNEPTSLTALAPIGVAVPGANREDMVPLVPASRRQTKRGVILAVRAALMLTAAAAVAAVLLLLGSHRAEAATPHPDRARAATLHTGNSPVPGPRGGPAVGRTPTPVTTAVRQMVRPVVPQVNRALTPVRQTLGPVVQQVTRTTTPATTPVRKTLDRLVPKVTGATAPAEQTLGRVVQNVTPTRGALPPPAARSGSRPAPIGSSNGSAHGAVGPGPASEIQPGATRGSSVLPGETGLFASAARSTPPSIDSRIATGLARSLAAELASGTHDSSQLPASPWPVGTVPSPQGSGGPVNGSSGLSAFVPGRFLTVCFLTLMIGLLLMWSPGRHRPKPEVSPA
jgi:hypothetical protein